MGVIWKEVTEGSYKTERRYGRYGRKEGRKVRKDGRKARYER